MATLIHNGPIPVGKKSTQIGKIVSQTWGRTMASNAAWLYAAYASRTPEEIAGTVIPLSAKVFNHTGRDEDDNPTGAFLVRADTVSRGVFRAFHDFERGVQITPAGWEAVPQLFPAIRWGTGIDGWSNVVSANHLIVWPEIYITKIRLWTAAKTNNVNDEMALRLVLYQAGNHEAASLVLAPQKQDETIVSHTDYQIVEVVLDLQSDIERRRIWRSACGNGKPFYLALEAYSEGEGGMIMDNALSVPGDQNSRLYTIGGLAYTSF